MKAKKRIGIWMDYTSAQIYENASGKFLLTSMESNFSMPVKQDAKLHSESLLHNKENKADQAYFKDLIDLIKDYDEVVLFGPTKAKTALYNQIKATPKFNKIFIESRDADKMTSNQMKNYVKDYFSQLLTKEKPFAY
jgi:stalled ribosome rescue protein Dom34